MLRLIFQASLYFVVLKFSTSSHFRGGTISWNVKQGTTVEFKFKMGWTYGHGPGCTENKIGQYVNDSFMGDKTWKCASGCPSVVPVASVFYFCTAASQSENWEQGENKFQYTFSGQGPFRISYTGSAWMALSYGRPNDWNIQTIVDLRPRSDTNVPNSSPITASKPMYLLQFKCHHELRIPMIDSDGDRVKCRWAVGNECASVCKALPVANLVEDTCTLVFTANSSNQYQDDGWYAVALTVEDYPRQDITIGGQVFTVNDSISAVPLQFLIHILGKPEPCDWKPEFVQPTPAEGSVIQVILGKTLNLKMYAANLKNPSSKVIDISLTSPSGLTVSNVTSDPLRTNVAYWDLTWTPRIDQLGDNVVCAVAENDKHQMSSPRCFTISALDINECNSNPCINGGTCVDNINKYACVCPAGYTGYNCQIDIAECQSNPCVNGGTCVDGINMYTCTCLPGYTGTNCQTDIAECQSNPCVNGGTCVDGINMYTCTCLPGYTGINCQTDIAECKSNPCVNGGTCVDGINMYTCTCLPGYTGINCQTDIAECQSNPCVNGGTCVDGINMYTCTCLPGYTGINCQTDIYECLSSPCQNTGTCIDDINGFTCICPNGFSGVTCQTDIDECLSNPCLHGGSCTDNIGSYQCSCPSGYTGENCEKEISECSSQPCKNNGTCIDQINRYTCHCAAGYTDTDCNIDINECLSHPCLNGGTCTDHTNDFTCTCAAGYSGRHCQYGRDHCIINPCVNNGTCLNKATTYECICPPDTTGTSCEVKISYTQNCPRLDHSNCDCVLSTDPFRPLKASGQLFQTSTILASIVGILLGLITAFSGYHLLLQCCRSSKAFHGAKMTSKPETPAFNGENSIYDSDKEKSTSESLPVTTPAVTNIYRTEFNCKERSRRVETVHSDW